MGHRSRWGFSATHSQRQLTTANKAAGVQERRLELDPPEVYHRPMDAEWRLLITTESTVIPSSVVEWWYSTHLFLRSNSADPKAKACSQTLETQQTRLCPPRLILPPLVHLRT